MTIARIQENISPVAQTYYDCQQAFSVTNGNVMLVMAWCDTNRTLTLSDSQGNTSYTDSGAQLLVGGQIYRFFAAPTLATGTSTITLLADGSQNGYRQFEAWELSGVNVGTIFDTTAVVVSGTSGAITTATDHAAIFAVEWANGGSYPTANSPLTQERQMAFGYLTTSAYQLDAGTAGSKTRSFATSGSDLLLAALRPTAGGGGSAPTITSCTPADGVVNSVQPVRIVGTNLAGAGTPTVTFSGAGVTAGAITLSAGNTIADFNVTITSGAAVGARILTYTTTVSAVQTTFVVRARSFGAGASGGLFSNGSPIFSGSLSTP